MLLKIVYGVNVDSFALFMRIWVEYSKNMTVVDKQIGFYDSDMCRFDEI